jgi:serine/threonine protein phosphatase 1
MSLLEKIQFDPKKDTLHVLGDAMDRGPEPLKCLAYIRYTPNVYYIKGNHDIMMLDYISGKDDNWRYNGMSETYDQYCDLTEKERESLLKYIDRRPYFRSIVVNNKKFILVHAGIDAYRDLKHQDPIYMTWAREEFFMHASHKTHITIFGHTPTYSLQKRLPGMRMNCSVYVDKAYKDKIDIDCGCVYGGALAALRLDDGAIFYVPSLQGSKGVYIEGEIDREIWDLPR